MNEHDKNGLMQILKNCRRFYRLWLFNYRGSLQIFPETISRKVKYLAKRENQNLAREAKTPKNPACRCLGLCMPLASAWQILGKRYAIICHRNWLSEMHDACGFVSTFGIASVYCQSDSTVPGSFWTNPISRWMMKTRRRWGCCTAKWLLLYLESSWPNG